MILYFTVGTANVVATQAEEFVVSLFSNHPDSDYTPLHLFITTTETDPFLVTVESQSGLLASETINPDDIIDIYIPDTYIVSNYSERYNGLIVKAEAGKTISVSVTNNNTYSTDSYLALPLHQYTGVSEYIYYALTPDTNSSDLKNRVLLVGGYNATNITIIPTQTIDIPSDLSPTGELYELSSNEALTIQLNRFETLLLESQLSLSGSKFIANKPVTFLSGHQCALIASDATNRSCDFTIEQFPPTLNWGKSFIFPLLSSQTGGSYLKIIAAENSTVATLHCTCTSIGCNENTTEVANINDTGSFMYYLIAPDTLVCSVTSNNPVLLLLEATSDATDDNEGDPFMMMIPPVAQYSNVSNYFSPIKDNFTSNYINIAIVGQPSQLLLDDQSVTNVSAVYNHDGSLLGYGLQYSTSADNHTLSVVSGSDTVYTAWMYGFDLSVGYGQSLGMNLLLTGKEKLL